MTTKTPYPNTIILGSDTGVGKSIVTGLLANYLIENGHDVTTQKWVQCGLGQNNIHGLRNNACGDIDIHNDIIHPHKISSEPSLRCPIHLELPASPHLAAREAGKPIDIEQIKNAYTTLSSQHDTVIIEGSGGLMVPIQAPITYLELIAELQLPSIIVIANKLGCINHALLTITALQNRSCPITGIIMTTPNLGTPTLIENDNPKIISEISGVPILKTLAHHNSLDQLKSDFETIKHL